MTWQPIETAPKDGTPIVGWCVHAADPETEDGKRLTVYAAHYEGLGHVEDGAHVLVWGGEVDDHNWECPAEDCFIPAWWFRLGSEFEEAANPVLWKPVGADPTPEELAEALNNFAKEQDDADPQTEIEFTI